MLGFAITNQTEILRKTLYLQLHDKVDMCSVFKYIEEFNDIRMF